ncbi:GNAT family N-acetyltransferase, partial [Seonamhaeicola sp.]|uniref:GNAT family N-acetyltransferase n=1 Tax=Seonamhaeicola sp. TaxID=1912245 RepID=UPI003563532A
MSKDTIVIREIKPEDNTQVEQIIRTCFHEFKIPLTGTAYEDEETPRMFQSYQNDNTVYYVIDNKGEVLGGAGIQPLKGFETEICELNKMYFSPKVRGRGYGKKMFETCLQAAKNMGYKQCYL